MEPAPLAPPSLGEIEGDSHAWLLTPLEELAVELDYRVAWVDRLRGGALGICRRRDREIEIAEGLAPNRQVSVLIHELCHALVGERDELRSIDYALEEIVVESAIFCPGRHRLRCGAGPNVGDKRYPGAFSPGARPCGGGRTRSLLRASGHELRAHSDDRVSSQAIAPGAGTGAFPWRRKESRTARLRHYGFQRRRHRQGAWQTGLNAIPFT